MAKQVVGLFDTMQDAQSAVQELRTAGFSEQDISIVASEARTGDDMGEGSEAVEGAAAGATGGAVLGGLGGLLVGLGALVIPGIGPVIAAGTLATALGTTVVGAGLGAAAGGLVGALVGAGIPEDDASIYAEGVRRGGALVTVQAATDTDAERAADILDSYNVVDIDQRSANYRSSGWTGFDENAEPVDSGSSEWDRSSKVGTAVGGVAGAATGAAIGSVAGPVGTVVGGVAGAVTGAGVGAAGDAAGEAAAEAADPISARDARGTDFTTAQDASTIARMNSTTADSTRSEWDESSKVGTTVGGVAGAATGAAIGSVAGPVGTVVGGVAGAVTGAGVGAAGDAAGEAVADATTGEDDLDSTTVYTTRSDAADIGTRADYSAADNEPSEWDKSSKVGTAVGGVAGAATGAAIGSVAGPVGTVVGGVAGAVTGAGVGAAGDAAGEAADERAVGEDTYRTRPIDATSSTRYEDVSSTVSEDEGPIERGLGDVEAGTEDVTGLDLNRSGAVGDRDRRDNY